MNAKANRQRTAIPVKQKNVIKLVMWTLYQVMDEETAKSKTLELLKLNESVENIIEQVDNIEKTEKYGEMETMMTMIRTNQVVRKPANVLDGDANAIIKEMVEMATAEVKVPKKPRAKTGGSKIGTQSVPYPLEPPSGEASVEASTPVETKAKKPRAKKTASAVEATVEATVEASAVEASTPVETKVKKPRSKKTASVEATVESATVEATATEASTPVETKVKKPRSKKTASVEATVEASAEATVEATATEPKVKKPRAKKSQAVVEPPVKEEITTTEDLQEEEYLVLNEVEYEGATYMVGTDQNVYDEFNAIIGKYENEKIVLNKT